MAKASPPAWIIWKELGVTHIHLLPVIDYYSVDEIATEFRLNTTGAMILEL